jgi:urease accessory protein
MSAAASAFDQTMTNGLQAIRAVGGLVLRARADHATSAIETLHEYGGYRIKCPAPRAPVLEAVMINTGGGVVGGDRISIAATAAAHSRLALTTATAERIYRANGLPTEIDVALSVEANATLAWLPQATIVFSGAAVSRHVTATMASSANLLIAETTAYGRTASGEVMAAGSFNDQWRIVRDGRLVFADATRLNGDISATLARPAVADGASISTLLVCVAPEAEARRDAVRDALANTSILSGVSAWNGLLTVRLLGDRLDHLANALRNVVAALKIVQIPAAWTH